MRHFGGLLFTAGLVAAIGLIAAAPVRAQDCPGNPNAIGTSRVLTLEPGELTRIGKMQYRQTLPLADKEVVITFDDGPLPPYSNQVLDILASECVKATYFLVGEMARAYPATVRRIYEAGHTIGTHSEDHPLRFDRISVDKMRWEIDQGIADVEAALGDPGEVAPFFRVPGLGRTATVESELAARSLVVFSSDTVADDWFHHIKPDQIISRAISRLEKRGGGILLLHDIHKATVAALPGLLKALKEHGFRIVHVVPATSAAPLVASLPDGWMAAYIAAGQTVMDDSSAEPRWPSVEADRTPDRIGLPAPDLTAFEPSYSIMRTASRASGDDSEWPTRPEASAKSSAPPSPPPSRQEAESSPADQRIADRPFPPQSGQDAGSRTEDERIAGKMFGLRPNLESTESDVISSDVTDTLGNAARQARRPPIGDTPAFQQLDEP